MFIRLFITTTSYDKASETVQNVVSNIPNELIKSMDYKVEPYWKFDDTMVAEITLEMLKELDEREKSNFLNSLSNNWMFLKLDKSEAISSKTMEGGCTINYDLEMIDIHFKD